MASHPWVAGPGHIFVATMTGSPQYLGTCERCPSITINRSYQPLMNDLGGQMVPFDRTDQDAEAVIRTDLTRWDEAVYTFIAGGINSQVRGSADYGTIGTLVAYEQEGFQLWVELPYASLPAYAGMPAAYHFFCAIPDADTLDPLGTAARKTGIVWHAQRVYVPASGSMLLYNNTASGGATS